MVLISIDAVKLDSTMLHAKFQDYQTSSSEEKFKGFYHLWAWQILVM